MKKYEQPVIRMIQVSECNWKIETKSGILLTDHIMIGLKDEAEEYVKRYASSFGLWNYELVLLKEEK